MMIRRRRREKPRRTAALTVLQEQSDDAVVPNLGFGFTSAAPKVAFDPGDGVANSQRGFGPDSLLRPFGQELLDRFEIDRSIGAGGMGTVYRAMDRQTGKPVALKIAISDNDHLRARALIEADSLAALDHPAIVRLVASGIGTDGRSFIAMEWLEGEDLATRLRRGPLSAIDTIKLGARIAEGLAAAHTAGIVHRDLKPSNLFLPNGDIDDVKIVDFGIARIGQRRMTKTGALIGTPGYMAPEQALGRSEIGPPVDLFALGAVLFECIAGKATFQGSHAVAILAKVLFDEAPLLDPISHNIPIALSTFVARLLTKTPAERPTSTEAATTLAGLLPMLAKTIAANGMPANVIVPNVSPVDPLEATSCDPSSARESVISRSDELRLVCVLVARTPHPISEVLEIPIPANTPSDPNPADEHPLEQLRRVVAPLGGRAEQILDGSLVVSWTGDGIARDLAARAARAALLARERLPRMVFALGSGLVPQQGALRFGPPIDRAAMALETSLVAPGVVLVDDITAGLLDDRFHLETSFAGHKLFSRRALDHGEARLLLGRAVPCVGRERELRVLGDLLADCIDAPRPCGAMVSAPPGIGKSRLRNEMLHRMRQRDDIEIWTAEADEFSAGSPFALIGGALECAMNARPGDAIDERGSKLEKLVARRVPEKDQSRITAFLGEIVSAHLPDTNHPMLGAARRDPALMAENVRRAFLDLLRAETSDKTVLIVVEDLHWADLASLKLLAAALSALQEQPFMMVGFARPEARERCPDLWAAREMQEIRLNGLARRSAALLARHVLPDAEEAVVEKLVERAEGNALYLEELLRAVASGRGDDLPETVAAMVQARLNHLGLEERRLLRAASIFGGAFWPSALAALLGSSLQAVTTLIDTLAEREVLQRRPESRFPHEQEFMFRHALLRDGAYALMTEQDRATGHRLAAEWLERQAFQRNRAFLSKDEMSKSAPFNEAEGRSAWQDRSEETGAARIAHHFEIGGANARAVEWYARAAEQTLHVGDPGGSAISAERGLALLATLPDENRPANIELRLQLSLFRGLSLTRGFTLPEVERPLRRAQELCPWEAPEKALILFGLWHFYVGSGKIWEARAVAADLLALAQKRGEPSGMAAAHLALGMTCVFLGEQANAREQFESSLALIDRTQSSYSLFMLSADLEVYCLSYLSMSLWALGQLDKGLCVLQRALAMAEKLAHPFTMTLALSFGAIHHQSRRDRQTAIDFAERLQTTAKEHGFYHYVLQSSILCGWARNDIDEIARAIAIRRARGANVAMTQLLTLYAEAQAKTGNLADALSTLSDASVAMNTHGERLWVPEVYRLTAEILRARGEPGDMDLAEDHLLRAIDVARCQGSLIMELRATVCLVRLWREVNNHEEGLQMLNQVYARFTEGFDNVDLEEARALLQSEVIS